MYIIDQTNLSRIEKICCIETAARLVLDVFIDLPAEVIREYIQSGKLSLEVALATTNLRPSDLAPIEDLSLLERLSSLHNEHYAVEWLKRRAEWPSLLYCTPDDPQIIQTIVRNCGRSEAVISQLTMSELLKAGYVDIERAVELIDCNDCSPTPPNLYVTDPALSMWRSVIDGDMRDLIFARTGWDCFNKQSPYSLYLHRSEAETDIVMVSNKLPLSVLVAKGYWTSNNLSRILAKIDESKMGESIMLILYERVCRLWGPDSELASEVKQRLKYNKKLTQNKVLQFYTDKWHPSIPAIHHYVLNATRDELEQIVETNYLAGVGIYESMGILTPMAARRICAVALGWLKRRKPVDTQAIRNVLQMLCGYTSQIPWSDIHAKIVQDALKLGMTKELAIRFLMMPSYPTGYKDEIISRLVR